MGARVKRSGEVLDYLVDFAADLADGDTIAAVAWSAAPVGLTLSGQVEAGTTSTIFAAGGAHGELYHLVAAATTAAGRVLAYEIALRIAD